MRPTDRNGRDVSRSPVPQDAVEDGKMPRQVRDRQALTYGVWSVIFATALAGFAWKFGWLPMEVSQKDAADVAEVDPLAEPDAAPSHDRPPVDSAPIFAEDDQTEPNLGTDHQSVPTTTAASDRRSLPFDATEFPLRPSRKPPEAAPPDFDVPAGITAPNRRKAASIDDMARHTEPPAQGLLFRPGRKQPEVVHPESYAGRDDENGALDRPPHGLTRSSVAQTGGEMPDESDTSPKGRAVSKARKAPAESSDPRLEEIDNLLASKQHLSAHKEMSSLYWKEPDLRPELQERIDENARLIYFSPLQHFMDPYVVNPGDQLQKIAKQYQVPWEYLVRLNKIDPKRIRPGQQLKVIKGPFGAMVDLSDFELIVHAHGYYVKRYQVGIGKDGSTPIGKHIVKTKLKNPAYYGPNGVVIHEDDTSNPLGERWIDLGNSYGIHGTIEPDSIGKATSRGCIRLNKEDVEEVFDLLSEGSEVIIRQ